MRKRKKVISASPTFSEAALDGVFSTHTVQSPGLSVTMKSFPLGTYSYVRRDSICY